MIELLKGLRHWIATRFLISFIEFNCKAIRVRAFTKNPREKKEESISSSLKDLINKLASGPNHPL